MLEHTEDHNNKCGVIPVKYYMNTCCASKSGWHYNVIPHREVEPVNKYTHMWCGASEILQEYCKNYCIDQKFTPVHMILNSFGTRFTVPVKLIIVYKAFITQLTKIMTHSTVNGLVTS